MELYEEMFNSMINSYPEPIPHEKGDLICLELIVIRKEYRKLYLPYKITSYFMAFFAERGYKYAFMEGATPDG